MAATVFGQARSAFLSAVGPLGRSFGKARMSADFTPRPARFSESSNLASVSSDSRSTKALALRPRIPQTGPDALSD